MTLNRWIGKVAFVTGASSGIGKQIAKDLVETGLIVAGAARTLDKLLALKEEAKGRFYPIQCDLTKEDDILNAFRWIESHLGGVDLLVNNAGSTAKDPRFLSEGNSEEWRSILETNILAMAICTREALKTMRTRGDDGIIINMNSLLGHNGNALLHGYPVSMYTISKQGVTAFTKCLREELKKEESNIKVSSISPGMVRSNMTDKLIEASNTFHLVPEDIADAVIYILSARPRTQIAELTILPVRQECT